MKVEEETEVHYLCGGELKAMDPRKQHELAQGTENLVEAVEDSRVNPSLGPQGYCLQLTVRFLLRRLNIDWLESS